jgi:hypothetical protein
MTGKNKIDGKVVREFIFNEDKIIVKEKITKPNNCQKIGHFGKVKAIHMASSGYFNNQFFKIDKNLVEFKEI